MLIVIIKKIMKNTYVVLLSILILSIFLGGCTTTSQTKIVTPTPTIQTACFLPSERPAWFGNTTTKIFPYVVNGQDGSIELTLDQKWYWYYLCRSEEMHERVESHVMRCDPPGQNCVYSTSTFMRPLALINESIEYSAVQPLVDAIKSKSTDPEMQARIAISLVQNIPYNYDKANSMTASNYTVIVHYASPYEVLYENTGICEEKSALLVLLLNELGYDSAYFEFDADHHAMVGIGSDGSGQYQNTGYIIIESTNPYPIGAISSSITSTPTVWKFPGTLKFHLSS